MYSKCSWNADKIMQNKYKVNICIKRIQNTLKIRHLFAKGMMTELVPRLMSTVLDVAAKKVEQSLTQPLLQKADGQEGQGERIICV